MTLVRTIRWVSATVLVGSCAACALLLSGCPKDGEDDDDGGGADARVADAGGDASSNGVEAGDDAPINDARPNEEAGEDAGGGDTDAGGGHLVVSTSNLLFPAVACGTGPNTPQSFTVTNTGGVPVTWTPTVNAAFSFFAVDPVAGSLLLPGEFATVTVTPSLLPASSVPFVDLPLHGTIAIATDTAGAASVDVGEPLQGAGFSWTPPVLDFGSIPAGSVATLPLTVAYSPGTQTPILGSDDPKFVPSVFNFVTPNTWTVTFSPTVGSHVATLTWGSEMQSVCTPNTLIARGVGIVSGNAGCLNTGGISPPDGTPCGPNEVCRVGQCLTQLTLTGAPFTFTPGTPFSGTVATATNVFNAPSALTATIDWGDGSAVSAGAVTAAGQVGTTFLLNVGGTHTYAGSGPYTVQVTLSDPATGTSVTSSQLESP